MNEHPTDLEKQLGELGWWNGAAPRLWEAAERSARSGGHGKRRIHRILRSPWPWIGVPVAAVIAVALFLPSIGSRHSEPPASNLETRSVARANLQYWGKSFYCPSTDDDAPREVAVAASPALNQSNPAWHLSYEQSNRSALSAVPQNHSATEGNPSDRKVTRKAAVDLLTDDVRGTYIKVQTLLVRESDGEYIESAQLTGSGAQVDGYVTLRVQTQRLSQVLQQLRGLADVTREQADAADVTSQVVDIDARLRNERRVEQEMLDLLDKRKDAPLQDVLKLSESLAQVRERIEQMTARQQSLSHQVALATLVVTVHAKAAPVAAISFWENLSARFDSTWRSAIDTLVRTVLALIQVLVGGLLFWLGLIVVVVLLRRWYLKAHAVRENPSPTDRR